jgi:hypothetical protein
MAAVFGGLVLAGASAAHATTCTGVCGTLGADGVDTAPPGGTTYGYVSTAGGLGGVGQIAGVGGTNGSEQISDVFSAAAADPLNFYFNYVTTDGSGSFSDYAFAELLTDSDAHVAWLFTARTTPSGDTSPGFGLPANDSTLTPSTSAIIGGSPAWSPIGGGCYAAGCGYTGWIKSDYSIADAGLYKVRFGVSNYGDTGYNSGLAFAGLQVGGVGVGGGGGPIGSAVPEPATWAMMITGFGMAGAILRRRRHAPAAA